MSERTDGGLPSWLEGEESASIEDIRTSFFKPGPDPVYSNGPDVLTAAFARVARRALLESARKYDEEGDRLCKRGEYEAASVCHRAAAGNRDWAARYATEESGE